MRKGLYRSLAFTNLKNHRRLYAPYLLACAGSAAMFYMMCFLATHSALRSMRGGRELTNVLVFGSVVIAIFSAVIVLYAIMRKVGLARDEVKASVRAQVLTVFFLPLAAAGVHVAFAFPLISVLFTMLALTNVTLFLFCTLGCFTVFALLYAAVYALTARTYYKIVAEAE